MYSASKMKSYWLVHTNRYGGQDTRRVRKRRDREAKETETRVDALHLQEIAVRGVPRERHIAQFTPPNADS